MKNRITGFYYLLWAILIFTGECGCAHSQSKGLPLEIRRAQFVSVPLSPMHWRIQYTGGGFVLFNPDGSGDMILSPKAAVTPDQTFSTLVTLIDTEAKPLMDYIVKLEVTTVKQLRQGEPPHDWEVFWFFGNFKTMPDDMKETNYFLIKTYSGVELGTAFGKLGQFFLKTEEEPVLNLGVREKWIIIKKDSRFRVFRNQNLILDYQDKYDKSLLFKHPGTFGLYTEDAYVRVHSFVYSKL
ncbi:MAG: hypothetical protein ACXVCY_15270 [Pseudobdellovibrionaceae bacterium]